MMMTTPPRSTERKKGHSLHSNEEPRRPSFSAPFAEDGVADPLLMLPKEAPAFSAQDHDEDCEVASNRLALEEAASAEESSDHSSGTAASPSSFWSRKASSRQEETASDTSKNGRRGKTRACCVSLTVFYVLALVGGVLVAVVPKQLKKKGSDVESNNNDVYEVPDLADYEQDNITIMETSEGKSSYPVTPIAQTCINDPTAVADMIGRIQAGEFLCSPSTRYRFGLLPLSQSPSELVVVDHDQEDSIVWTSGTLYETDDSSKASPSSVSLDLDSDGTLLLVDDDTNNVVAVVVEGKGTSDTVEHPDDAVDGGSSTLRVDDLGVASIYHTHQGYTWSTATAVRNPASGSNDTSTAILPPVHAVDTATLERKVMVGYQGWFGAQGDGGYEEWAHWSDPRDVRPNSNSLVFDLWPDLRELEPDELYETDLVYRNGAKASVFSSTNTKTVERHMKWMSDYGLDGVFVQRFVTELADGTENLDKVLLNVKGGCEKYGRAFAVMYDIVGVVSSSVVNLIIDDWKYLVDDLRINQSHMYLKHRGRPLVAIWGVGFVDIPTGLHETNHLLNFFQNQDNLNTPPRFQTSVMAGVPVGWRDLTRDSRSAAEWVHTFRRFDVLSPWTIGRYNSLDSADVYRRDFIEPDKRECNELGIDYLPVAFPGFSQFNLVRKPFNEIQRLGGTFFWRQLFNILAADNNMIYIAMFDEVDEATAIFKAADRQAAIPRASVLSLNDDGGCVEHVPSDWYLQLTGEATKHLHRTLDLPRRMPSPGTIDGFPLQIAETPVPLSVTCFPRGPRAPFTLELNQYICSSSGAYALGLNGKGNFGVWNIFNGRLIWQTGTEGTPGTRMFFQSDGNLVIYSHNNEVLYSTGTPAGGPGIISTLSVNNKGLVTITQTRRGIVWTSWCIDDGPEAILELGILEAVCSPDHRYRFGVTNSGDMGLFRTANDQTVWHTATNSGQSTRMVLQQDGNLVLYGSGRALFSSSRRVSSHLDVPKLIVDDGGVASVVHSTRVVWTTSPCSGAGPDAPFDLGRGAYRCSPDGSYRFGLTNTGELAMFNNLNGQKVWDAGIQNGVLMRLQTNGNLVVFGQGNAVLFSTATTRSWFFQSTSLSVGNNGVTTLVRDGLTTVWASGCVNYVPHASSTLRIGEYVCSASRSYMFGLTDQGRLRVFNSRTDVVQWDAGVLADLGSRIWLQPDGNMVLYDSKNGTLFASNTDTADHHTTYIHVDNSGNALVQRHGQRSAWTSRNAVCGR